MGQELWDTMQVLSQDRIPTQHIFKILCAKRFPWIDVILEYSVLFVYACMCVNYRPLICREYTQTCAKALRILSTYARTHKHSHFESLIAAASVWRAQRERRQLHKTKKVTLSDCNARRRRRAVKFLFLYLLRHKQ